MRAVKLLLAAILVAGAGSAMAQAWPAKPVRLVCPTPAGTPVDLSLRLVAERLDIVQRMNREIDPIVKDTEYIQKLLPFGFTTLGGAGTPQQIAELMRSERENWDTMLKGVRIEPQ